MPMDTCTYIYMHICVCGTCKNSFRIADLRILMSSKRSLNRN